MRDLRRSSLLLGLLTLAAVVLAFGTSSDTAAGTNWLAAQQVSDLELALSVTPAAVQPGEQAIVSIFLKNLTEAPIAPELFLTLPTGVSADLRELPAATTYNAQNGTVNWQQVIPGNGGELQLTFPVIAMVADMHAPEQVLRATLRSGDREISQDVILWVGPSPSAAFSVDPPQASVGQPVKFVGRYSGPQPVSQLWALGDGRIVEAQDPVVVYPAPGTYEVVFQASSPLGVVTTTGYVTVVAQPLARFSIPNTTPTIGDVIAFANESGGAQPLSYFWDFGDGATSSEEDPVHTYQVPGSYEVSLVVSGPQGEVSEAARTIVVGETPIADVIVSEVVDAGAVIQGQAFTDDTVTSITWDMGDGTILEGDLISHVYWTSGEHLITVNVSNLFGETMIQRLVKVNPGPLFLYFPIIIKSGLPEVVLEPSSETVVEEVAGTENGAVAQIDLEQELPSLDLPAEYGPGERLLAYINESRRLNGLAPLDLVPSLSVAAQAHADDMAALGHTAHTGSDGTVPALRIQLSGYPGGYAGEATAWGMPDAADPVRYWLSSPSHRQILLNPAASDVGVGYSENLDSPSIWYWTAEFASMNLPVVEVPVPAHLAVQQEPTLDLLGPPRDSEFLLSADTNLIFTWSWPEPLLADERFALYINSQGRTTQLGTVTQPQGESQYQFVVSAANVPVTAGQQEWFIRLEETLKGEMREQSESWPIRFVTQP